MMERKGYPHMMTAAGSVLCVSFILLHPRALWAETSIADMVHGCKVAINLSTIIDKNETDQRLAGECLGAIQDVVEENRDALVCLPKNALFKDVIFKILPKLAEMVQRYKGRRTHFHDLLALTLHEEYPCNKSSYVLLP